MRFWSSWDCPRQVGARPRRESPLMPRGVEAQAARGQSYAADSKRSVMCFDETPTQLIGEVRTSIARPDRQAHPLRLRVPAQGPSHPKRRAGFSSDSNPTSSPSTPAGSTWWKSKSVCSTASVSTGALPIRPPSSGRWPAGSGRETRIARGSAGASLSRTPAPSLDGRIPRLRRPSSQLPEPFLCVDALAPLRMPGGQSQVL